MGWKIAVKVYKSNPLKIDILAKTISHVKVANYRVYIQLFPRLYFYWFTL